MTFFRLENKWFVWPLFLFLITYAILRAILIEPLLDELGTYYWYIQTGLLPGHGAAMDANNHILNSFISNTLYNTFGDHFFLFRLFALSTFPIYFYACRRLILKINPSFPVIVFLALISVHWIFDYFSLTRGYGPALAFLMLTFCFINDWNKTLKPKYFAFTILCFVLALLSNLSLLIPIVLLFGYLILTFAIRIKKLSRVKIISFLITTLLFIGILIPVYIYIQKLKKSGALWWGSTDGLWEVTGKSLSQNVFFTDHPSMKYLIIIFLILILVLSIINWRKEGFKKFLFEPGFWVTGLFLLCLISFVLMAELMKVNYPMDRVGMYLIPVFILSFALSIQAIRSIRWVLLVLLWFPCSFVWKMNLNTNIFSPEDRMRLGFYELLQNRVANDQKLSVSMDYVSHASFAHLNKKEAIAFLAVESNNDTLSLGDYHVSWYQELNNKNYNCIYVDPISKTRLYKRKSKPNRTLVMDTCISTIQSDQQYITYLAFPINGKYKRLQTVVDAKIHLTEPTLKLNLNHGVRKKDNSSVMLQETRFDWYFGNKTDYGFHFPNQTFIIAPEDDILFIYLNNTELRNVRSNNVKIKIYSVE